MIRAARHTAITAPGLLAGAAVIALAGEAWGQARDAGADRGAISGTAPMARAERAGTSVADRTVQAPGAPVNGPAAANAPQKPGRPAPEYRGIDTRLLADDMVSFLLELRGARGAADIDDYAGCAAAQYALIRGYGYARHVRTNTNEMNGLTRADAVYVISREQPRGLDVIPAEARVRECSGSGIPTV